MMKMHRETATDYADLPHQFEAAVVRDECRVCYGVELDPKHVAWERASLTEPAASNLPRERGV